MKHGRTRFASIVRCLLLGAIVSTPAQVSAQEIQVTGPLAGAPAVRTLRLHRKGRVELAPTVSATLLDEYQRTILFGARINYNLFDWLAIGVWGAYGAVKSPTGLSDKIQSVNDARFDKNSGAYNTGAGQTDRLLTAANVGKTFKDQLGTIDWIVSPQITAIPFRGKLSLFQKIFVDTDAYIFAGPAFIGVKERQNCGSGTAVDCSQTNADGTITTKALTSRVAIAPTFGLGLSFYTNSWTSIGIEYRALPFARNTGGFDILGGGPNQKFPDNKVNNQDRELKFNQMITLSVGFYFPTKMNLSE